MEQKISTKTSDARESLTQEITERQDRAKIMTEMKMKNEENGRSDKQMQKKMGNQIK